MNFQLRQRKNARPILARRLFWEYVSTQERFGESICYIKKTYGVYHSFLCLYIPNLAINTQVHDEELKLETMVRIEKRLDSFPYVSYFLTKLNHYEELKPVSTLSGHIEYAIPVGTFSLVRDRGLEYSASGHRKVKLLDQMKLVMIFEPFRDFLVTRM